MMPTDHDIDSDRFAILFDVAAGYLPASHADLSDPERQEISRIRQLFHVIDQAWMVPEDRATHIRKLLLENLAREHPDHPWLQGDRIETLGDLVRSGDDDMPVLPPESYEALAADDTPVEMLQDPATGYRALGEAVLRAGLGSSDSLLEDFVTWVNTAFRSLVRSTDAPTFVRARQQRPARKQKSTESPEDHE